MPAHIVVQDVLEVPSLNPDRAGKTDLLINYQVDAKDLRGILIPREEVIRPGGAVDTAKVRQRIEEVERTRQAIKGISFQV
jgi:hypothetical protein